MTKHFIYMYTNKINGKKYIGRTINVERRKRQHRSDSKRRQELRFYKALQKYGEESFDFQILEETENPQERETHFIQFYDTMIPNGYNMKEHDMDMTEDIRRKIGEKNTGKVRSTEHRKSISEAQKGVPKSEEHKKKISDAHIGITHTEESKKKIALGASKKWIITFPDGHEEIITNMNRFCKENGLSQGNLYKVVVGTKNQHKGYKARKYDDPGIRNWLNGLGYRLITTQPFDGIDPTNKFAFMYHKIWPADTNKNTKKNIFNICQTQKIQLFTIYENEWRDREPQVKNFILGALGNYKTKLYARDCTIHLSRKSEKSVMDFFNSYHIQGAPNGYDLCVVLYHKGIIIGAMSFGKHHRQNGGNSTVLTRLCWKTGYRVIGGSQRMFSYRPPGPIISWSDNRWSTFGGVYERLGFTLETEYPPSYDYVNNLSEFKHKQTMTKAKIGAKPGQTEEERAEELGWYRLYDCGKKKWVFTN